MDVRQFAFLARQPSAVVQTREHFWGLPKRGLAFLLANVMFWQPLWAQADGIVVATPGTSLERAGNGVPIVNIATPNGSGVSHNQFHDYNVGAQGLILNNGSLQTSPSQLGGIIIGNPNLKNIGSAQTILNEVIGGSPSQLRGYTEVAGQSARVIVANPYGITCNGCGFINTPRVTLTTGKPVFDGAGRLDRFQVDQGSIAVEGAGLNATNIDRFDIITRSAKINAEIQAKHLTIVAGRNDVNADSLSAPARADDGSAKPRLAIDSSALGGMYAGAIRLVGTEAGVGVKVAGNLAASAGDIQIDVNGHLSLAHTSAAGAVTVKAASLDAQGPVYAGTAVNMQTQGDLTNQQTLAARDRITLNAGGQLTNNGSIEAGVNADNSRNTAGDVSLSAQSINNTGKSVVASRNLTVNSNQTLNNQSGTLSAGQTVRIIAGVLDNRSGQILGDLGLSIDLSGALDNRDGLLGARSKVDLNAASLDNRGGKVIGKDTLTLEVDDLLANQFGTIITDGELRIAAGKLVNRNGGVVGKTDAVIRAESLDNQQGKLIATGRLNLSAGTIDNRQAGLLGATGATTLAVDNIDNRGGELTTNADLLITSEKIDNSDGGKLFSGMALKLAVDELVNRNKGLISASTALSLQGSVLDNSGGKLVSERGTQLMLTGALHNIQGQVSSEGALSVNAAQLINTNGRLSSASDLLIDSHGNASNHGGVIVTDGALILISESLDNRQQGNISGKGAVTVTTGAFDNSVGGRLTSADTLNLVAGQVTNQNDGHIGSEGAMTASVTGLDQQGGKLFSKGSLSLDLNNGLLNNQNGLINTPGALLLKQLKGVENQGGEISSAETFKLTAQSLDNSDGKLLSNQGLTVRIADALDNVNGLIGAASVDVHAARLNNSGGRLISRGDLELAVDSVLRNDANGLINSQGKLTLNATQLDSSNGGEVSAKGDIDLTLTSLTQDGGRLLGERAVTVDLTHGDLDNRNGMLTAKGPLTFKHLRNLQNQGGEISSNLGFEVVARTVNNRAGKLISSQLLSVDSTTLDNQKGLISGWKGLTVSGDSLDNRYSGTLSSNNGDVVVDLSGALLNSDAGALASQGSLSVKSTSLDNSNKGVLSSAAGQTFTVTGVFDNSLGGLIDSGATLDISAVTLTNAGGKIEAQKAINATVVDLDNSAGSIAGSGAVTLGLLGTLTNAHGKLAAAGPTMIKGVTDLDNQSGQIASQRLLTVLTGSLDNSNNGSLSAKDAVQISASGAVHNSANGLIYSQNAGLTVQAASLTSNAGALLSQDGLILDISGDLDNQNGKVIAQNGDVTVQSAHIDNRNGVISAKGMASVTGRTLDNDAGKIAGDRIELNLSRGMSNRAGIVESATDLAITATSLYNQTGRLRSLGNVGNTRFQIGGLLDNRNGVLETANTDLTLAVGSFLNTGGELNHAGRGQFDISTANVIAAGGRIITGGTLDLNAASWANSSVIQARRLNVNVNHFSQTASGQLLASDYLQARGENWINDGLIASDGDLDMQLGGSYGGNGRLSSVGGLNLSVAQINLGVPSSVAGGGDSTVKAGGQLANAGRLTSNAGLTIEAGSIVNSGTLGSAQGLELKTPSLLNDGGLIFSGADMTLGVESFTNQKGDLYGLRKVVIQGYGAAAQASQVSNISGSMESGGSFTLGAGSFTNRTSGSDGSQNFGVGRTLMSGFIAVQCGDCRGDHFDVNFIAREVFEGRDTDTAASATLTAGGDFTFNGGDFLNSKSTVSAAGNISINANNLKNLGSVGGIIERARTYRTGRVTDGTINRFMPAVVAYNQRNNPDFPNLYYLDGSGGFALGKAVSAHGREPGHDGGLIEKVVINDASTGALVTSTLSGYAYGATNPQSLYDGNNLVALPGALGGLALLSDIEAVRAGGSPGRTAVIQAGGSVSITATKDLQNSVIHADYGTTAGTNKVGDTRATGKGTTVVRINAQLPPDLAQQQVNPLSLPGFTLPTGQNGLFRLNTQEASTPAAGMGTPGWSVSPAAFTSPDHVSVAGGDPRDLRAEGDHTVNPVNPSPTWLTNADISAALGNRPSVTGLSPIRRPAAAHKYLIETNPVLTDLKQFMSSDYLLSKLGYDSDLNIKRLGDGLYEQRLIQQAVVARTGQRYINGQTTDEGLFKYLMNNAIASKDALNLSMGVSLTSQQVAALTHDIVWLEEHEVNGEKVLVPVLYLSQAEGRLGPTGALIAGKDVTLIGGEKLDNVGTLKATNNLAATAGKDLVNSGLIQAGNRLDVLAGNGIINRAGGILAGRDVSVTAITGDVLNERTIISQHSNTRFGTRHHDYADTAARIEAANDLSVSAGKDLNVIGGVLHSGRDIDLNAGRDLNVISTQVSNSIVHDARHNSSDITQLSASLSAGRDLSTRAGRDLNVIASEIDAKRDIVMAAGENLTISSAADEAHTLSKSKKLTRQEDHINQVMSGVMAGGDVALSAGGDLAIVSSRVSAGDEAYLVAGNNLDVLAAQDTDYSLYDKKKKGSFGAKKTRRDEVTDVKNIGSEIRSGGDLMLVSGGDQRYQVAKLESGHDLTLSSGGAITFEGVKDLHQESHEKSNSNLAWSSMSGKGNTDETLRQSQLVAQGQLVIRAVDGLNIDIKQINQNTISQTIDAMVKADPQLAWLKDAEKRGDVDWRLIKETHESFKYSHSGLGQGAMLAIIIIVTVLTAGAASAAVASVGTAMGATAGGTMAAATTATAATATTAATSAAAAGLGNVIATGVLTSVVSTAAVSTINNKGNLGAALKDVFSSENLKGYVLAGATAGIASQFGFVPTELSFDSAGIKAVAIKIAADTAAKTAIMGGSLTDNLVDAIVGAGIAIGGGLAANKIGDVTLFENGKLTKVAMHAALGGLMAEAMGGEFRTGALAAGANEAVVEFLADKLLPIGVDRNSPEHQQGVSQLLAASKLIGVLTAAMTGGDATAAAAVTANATQYNNLNHSDARDFVEGMGGCTGDERCQIRTWKDRGYGELSDELFEQALKTGGVVYAKDQMGQIAAGLTVLNSLDCTTQACSDYKFMLTDRALKSMVRLGDIVGQWEPVLGAIAGIAGGVAGSRGPKPAGAEPVAGSAQLNKAYEYWSGVKQSVGAKGISLTIEPKIADQMGKRGWTESSIKSVIDKPIKTVVTKDTRFDTVLGSRLNDPATGYIAKDGSYVVRNDRTGAIVQVSNKNDPGWVAPWD
ncbi:colicin E5-related ribonuclease [Pseudomonas sp. 14P_8.1_Bac3]|uniref:two-partner secretion domain-containing protein n=1 Tax=Pseudomonas sp. 14P_8.1_Bac3 TaxID=2971621 RepID=UPI0021C64913|nr:colicin E5-related ribonuclease [Pseudomonas sp. 14P_8.1_Bac3]MCU1758988.1 colicin E5-related ribonuclease [Pseudomonas sp. 14P_8.1_Bac3]